MTLPGGGVPNDIAHRWHSAWRGGVGGSYGGSSGGMYGAFGELGPLTPVIAPPAVWRPPQATDFNLFSTLAGLDTANTTPPAEFPETVFILPQGNIGVIRAISLLANNLLITSDIRWTLLFDESPVPGWSQLTVNPRAAGSVEISWTPEETFIPIPEGCRMSWQVHVADGGTYQVSVVYHGWFFPSTFGG